MEVLKVSAKSNPNSVAGALAGVIRENGSAEMQAIGAGALNQAVKAVAIARGYLIPVGIDVSCTPSFAEIAINGEVRTAIRFNVDPHVVDGATLSAEELGSIVSSASAAHGA